MKERRGDDNAAKESGDRKSDLLSLEPEVVLFLAVFGSP